MKTIKCLWTQHGPVAHCGGRRIVCGDSINEVAYRLMLWFDNQNADQQNFQFKDDYFSQALKCEFAEYAAIV